MGPPQTALKVWLITGIASSFAILRGSQPPADGRSCISNTCTIYSSVDLHSTKLMTHATWVTAIRPHSNWVPGLVSYINFPTGCSYCTTWLYQFIICALFIIIYHIWNHVMVLMNVTSCTDNCINEVTSYSAGFEPKCMYGMWTNNLCLPATILTITLELFTPTTGICKKQKQ